MMIVLHASRSPAAAHCCRLHCGFPTAPAFVHTDTLIVTLHLLHVVYRRQILFLTCMCYHHYMFVVTEQHMN